MEEMKHRRLQELDRSDFEIVKGEPDIRGWDVRNNQGQKIGEVEELIIDAQQKKVRYMVVDLDDNELELDQHKVLIPIGLAELHEKDDDVILSGVQTRQLRALPDYDKDHLEDEVERKVCSVLGRNMDATTNTQTETTSSDFYKHDYYNDDNLYKHRLHEATSGNEKKEESEYERGLRLWEMRSEGGILPNSGESSNERTVDEEARMEKVRHRRDTYQQRRYSNSENKNEQRTAGSIREEDLPGA